MWKKITSSYDEGAKILSDLMKNGDPELDNYRCVYTSHEDLSIHLVDAFTMLNSEIKPEKIKTFSLYQMIKK